MKKDKPNVYIIGVQKSGTTSLYHTLRNHEDIFGPEIKDYKRSHPFFFEQNYFETRESQFLKLFKGHKYEKLIITSDVDIIESEEAMNRVKLYSKNPKIIICVRNPFSRIESMFKFYKQIGRIRENTSFEKAINDNYDMFLKRSLYFDKLSRAFSIFGYENIMLIHFEEIVDPSNSEQVFNHLYNFLGIHKKSMKLMHKNKTKKKRKSVFRRIFEIGRGSKIRTKTVNTLDKFLDANRRYQIKEFLFDNKEGKINSEYIDIPKDIQILLRDDAKKVSEKFKIHLIRH